MTEQQIEKIVFNNLMSGQTKMTICGIEVKEKPVTRDKKGEKQARKQAKEVAKQLYSIIN